MTSPPAEATATAILVPPMSMAAINSSTDSRLFIQFCLQITQITQIEKQNWGRMRRTCPRSPILALICVICGYRLLLWFWSVIGFTSPDHVLRVTAYLNADFTSLAITLFINRIIADDVTPIYVGEDERVDRIRL